jgi:N-acyl-D-aspartate/D-glutamate deacylase
MLDVKLRGGEIIDGTGTPRRLGDVGIRDGRIAVLGRVDEPARETVDVSGRVVCPGFVDLHTHYDAQVFWDGTLSPSSFHGVTTIVGGNCGFSIAPLSPEAGPYLMRMLARVEGMPLESLRQGVPWDWRSFGEYLGRLEGRLAINAGFMVGHCALRRVVMGKRAVGERAGADDLARMQALLAESIEQGGLGFSSTISATHNDGDGEPVPSRHASREEILELARVCGRYEGTAIEFLPGVPPFGDEQKQLMADISLAAQRPLNWNVLVADGARPEAAQHQLDATDYARARGAEVLALTVPQPMALRINLLSGFLFDALHGWAELFKLPPAERMTALRDPEYRRRLDQDAHSPQSGVMRGLAHWERLRVHEVFTRANQRYQGRSIGEIAAEGGQLPFDALVEIALADDLRTSFMPPLMGDDEATWKLRGELWRDDRTIIGASDAGAHLDMIDTFAQTTQVLGNGVRVRGLLSLEDAIHRLTAVPARLYGLRHRGVLREGWIADLVVFDPERIACGPTYTRFDLPAGAGRLYADPEGVERVYVSGICIIRDGRHTGALPGTPLHSGRDTHTVPPNPAWRRAGLSAVA